MGVEFDVDTRIVKFFKNRTEVQFTFLKLKLEIFMPTKVMFNLILSQKFQNTCIMLARVLLAFIFKLQIIFYFIMN